MKIKYLLLICTLLALLSNSCNTTSKSNPGKTISVSILPQKTFVKAIAGEAIIVNVMIPPGASHSSYESTARQMNTLVNSTAYF